MSGNSTLKLALLANAASVNVQLWCEGLSDAGAEVHLLSFSDGPVNSTRFYRLPALHLPGKTHYIAAAPYVRRLIRTIKPNVVLGYYVTGYGTLARLVRYRPTVQIAAGTDLLISPRNRFLRWLVRNNLIRADRVLALAPHMAEAAMGLGVSPTNLVTIPHGIPLHRFGRRRCPKPSLNDVPAIICTRSLHPAYHTDVLLRALHLLHSNGHAFSLTLAGDGPQKSELVALAEELKIQNHVRFIGFVPNEQLSSLLPEHNLYVSLIEWDGVSSSLLEAMSVGLFPIVHDNPANRFWTTSGINGLLLSEISPARLVDAIKRGMSDVALRERAWHQNPELIHASGDLRQNSTLFVEYLKQLANLETHQYATTRG